MKVLIVVDMQNDFIDGALGTVEAQGIVDNVKAKIVKAEKNKDKIIFTRDTHNKSYLDTQEGTKLPVEHCLEGTYGWEIFGDLNINNHDIFDKPTFGSVDLAEYLYDIWFYESDKIESIELVGLCTDICVISNAMLLKAFFPEIPITIDASCCAGVTPESHKNALGAMKMCQINVIGE
jgi:nicotinamidase-related amidase